MVEALIIPDVMALTPQDDQPIQAAEVVVKWLFVSAGGVAMFTNYAGPGLALIATGLGVHAALSWRALRYRSELLQRKGWVRGYEDHCIISVN